MLVCTHAILSNGGEQMAGGSTAAVGIEMCWAAGLPFMWYSACDRGVSTPWTMMIDILASILSVL